VGVGVGTSVGVGAMERDWLRLNDFERGNDSDRDPDAV
jgi:hypothetical protein